MFSKKHVFSESGPCHLTSVNWNDVHQRRVVIASLVKGASVLERDRQKRREGPEALATPWSHFFGFQLEHKFVDSVDATIFGAIYKYTFPPVQNAPNYAVAFRGTIINPESILRDIKLDAMCISHSLHKSSRFNDAMQQVRNLVETVGASNVWLAGHSLGSAIAMLVGKDMARAGIHLETYLFNPLFLSLPIERIKNSKLSLGIRITSSMIKAGVAVTRKAFADRPLEDSHFAALSTWVPYLFVNPHDHICSGYIGYFEHRRKMEAIGARSIEVIATQNSLGSIISGALGNESKPLHLLPSAHLTVNLARSFNCKQAHGIRQWWDNSTHCHSMMYQL